MSERASPTATRWIWATAGGDANNPWFRVPAGQDLVDGDDTGTVPDAVAGLQHDVGSLAAGASASWGVALGFEIFGAIPSDPQIDRFGADFPALGRQRI